MVRFWHKADMLNALTNVHFWGQSGSDQPLLEAGRQIPSGAGGGLIPSRAPHAQRR